MTPFLQLAQQTFSSQLALEVFDSSLNPFAVNDDLEGLALYGFARVSQGTGTLSDNVMECKSRKRTSQAMSEKVGSIGLLARIALAPAAAASGRAP